MWVPTFEGACHLQLPQTLRTVFPFVALLAAVAQWLRRCATNRKVAGSIPDGVIGIFH